MFLKTFHLCSGLDELFLIHHRNSLTVFWSDYTFFNRNVSCRTSDPTSPHFFALLQQLGMHLLGCILRRATNA